MERRIALLLADGFGDSGLAIALDVFRAANSLAKRAGKDPPFHVDVVTASGGPVRAASGLTIADTRAPRTVARADIVLVPGIWVEDAGEVDALFDRPDVQKLVQTVRAAHARKTLVASSCGGAFILGEAGILDDRECTTTWWLAPHLKKRRPRADVCSDKSLVVTDGVITAGAVFAQADVALHLVARFAGPTTARQCSKILLLDEHPSQAPYMAIHQLGSNDDTVRRAEKWVRAHVSEPFDIAMIAKVVGVSARTLARRLASAVGVSPIGFVQRIRVETAVHLIETTRMSLQEVSDRVGYADVNALRKLIQRETERTPRELRRVTTKTTRVTH